MHDKHIKSKLELGEGDIKQLWKDSRLRLRLMTLRELSAMIESHHKSENLAVRVSLGVYRLLA